MGVADRASLVAHIESLRQNDVEFVKAHTTLGKTVDDLLERHRNTKKQVSFVTTELTKLGHSHNLLEMQVVDVDSRSLEASEAIIALRLRVERAEKSIGHLQNAVTGTLISILFLILGLIYAWPR